MSSEEVAELAEAIHSHADALYESWTKGSTPRTRTDVMHMRRMEDTLELLADPQLTPSLENLVSNFVKRDKAKRQQIIGNSPMTSNHKSNMFGRNRSASPRLMGPPPDDLTSGLYQTNRKVMPKSILAVVQRFEAPPSETNSSVSGRALSPSHFGGSVPVSSKSIQDKLFGIPIQHQMQIVPDVPPLTQKQSVPNSLRVQSPTKNTMTFPFDRHQKISGVNSLSKVQPTREHRIPIIQRNEDGSISGSNDLPTNNIHIINVNMNAPGSPRETFLDKSQGIRDLEREEERLFHALRTGQIVLSKENSLSPPRNNIFAGTESPRRRSPDTDSLNNNSRVAFAKERIRHSQEHPLTQQRLELQKRLPSPSSNLASAIALQQGKTKFQPNGDSGTSQPHLTPRHHHIRIEEEKEPPKNVQHQNHQNGRHSWTSSLQRFGPGSSVADRVQQFEKYPTHIVSNGNITSPPHLGDSSHNNESNRLHSHAETHHHSHLNNQYSSHLPSQHTPKEITHPITQLNTHVQLPLGDPPKYDSLSPKYDLQVPKYEFPSQAHASRTLIEKDGAPWRVSIHPQQPDCLTSPKHIRSPTSLDISRKFNEYVPRFYWPEGKPPPTPYIQETISKAETEFAKFLTLSINYEEFGKFLVNIGICLYWKKPFWTALGLPRNKCLEFDIFRKFYHGLISQCPDEASRFMRIVWTAKNILSQPSLETSNGTSLDIFPIDFKKIELTLSDFVPMIQDIVDTHPGLGFLRDAPEFHSRYVTTVISRIFYKVNRSWTGRLTLSEIRRSNLLGVIKRVEQETDVNAITEYFSYEHFYVIYCKFWELDKDHDLLIDKSDLARHNDQALSSLIVERIFSGTVLRGWDMNSNAKCPRGKMTYSDFVWFVISEEDKKTKTAIEYWFRCLDLDGDGLLSPFELQYFYREQERRIESLGIEPLDFSNVFCQMVDMLRCSPKGVRLNDLKRNPQLASNFFNTLFNLDKYLDHEQRDPFASSGTGMPGMELSDLGESDWDRYAATEYELLIAEESPSDHMLNDSSDFEDVPS